MHQTFDANDAIMRANYDIRLAVMKLSMAGYIVLRTTTTPTNPPSIQVDRAVEGWEPQIQEHAGKKIASYTAWGCRIYWVVEE